MTTKGASPWGGKIQGLASRLPKGKDIDTDERKREKRCLFPALLLGRTILLPVTRLMMLTPGRAREILSFLFSL